MQRTPIASVVIPTYGRPQYLSRAVMSCIDGFSLGEIEVIVVPNGPDDSWKSSLSGLNANPMVKIFPLANADANAARNHGLLQASAGFVRFLDDDDFLLPHGAREQYQLLEKSGADLCTGAVSFVDRNNEEFDLASPSKNMDFAASLLSRDTVTIPVPHVFRKQFIEELRWLPNQPFLQDQLWMHIVCRHAEIQWVKVETTVGVWHHHHGHRISTSRIPSADSARKVTSKILMDTAAKLAAQNRLNTIRKKAVATELWKISHEQFFFRPWFWHGVARKAMHFDHDARPQSRIHMTKFGNSLNPLLLEWIIFPFRWLKASSLWLYRHMKNIPTK